MTNNIPFEEPKVNIPRQATTPGYKHHRLVPMLKMHEGKELVLPMVALNPRENSEVEAKAFADTSALFGGKIPKKDDLSAESWKNIFEMQKNIWLLFYAVRVPEDLTKKWFISKQQIEEDYLVEEIGILSNNYISVVLTQPHLTVVDYTKPGAYQAVIDQIKKMGEDGDFFLNGLTTHSVNQLIRYLVAQVESFQKNNGSSGTP